MSFKGLTSNLANSYDRRQKAKDASDAAYKLVMVGDSGVGKSCLLERLLDQASTNNFISTIGVDVRTHNIKLNGLATKLQVWDTGGQQRYRPVLSTCYRNAHGVIIVFDVTNAKSFSNLKQWMAEVDEFTAAEESRQQMGKIPRLLVGNKSDLVDRREVDVAKADAFAADNGMLGYIETSAIGGANITEAFLALVKKAAGNKAGKTNEAPT